MKYCYPFGPLREDSISTKTQTEHLMRELRSVSDDDHEEFEHEEREPTQEEIERIIELNDRFDKWR